MSCLTHLSINSIKTFPGATNSPGYNSNKRPSVVLRVLPKLHVKKSEALFQISKKFSQAPIPGVQHPTKIARKIRGLISNLEQKLAQELTPRGCQMSHKILYFTIFQMRPDHPPDGTQNYTPDGTPADLNQD